MLFGEATVGHVKVMMKKLIRIFVNVSNFRTQSIELQVHSCVVLVHSLVFFVHSIL